MREGFSRICRVLPHFALFYIGFTVAGFVLLLLFQAEGDFLAGLVTISLAAGLTARRFVEEERRPPTENELLGLLVGCLLVKWWLKFLFAMVFVLLFVFDRIDIDQGMTASPSASDGSNALLLVKLLVDASLLAAAFGPYAKYWYRKERGLLTGDSDPR